MIGRFFTHERAILAALLVVTLLALPILTYPLGRDQGEFATIGRGLLQGKIPYRDLWNPKPPAIFYVYALAMTFFGQTSAALRALDLLLVPPVGLCLWWIGRRISGPRTGLWAALLFAVFYFTESFWTLTQNDGIALLPMALSVVAMLKAVDARRNPGWALLAGVGCGLAVWFKYPFALFGLALAAGYAGLRWMTEAGRPGRRWTRHDVTAGAGFLIGGLVTLAGGALYLQAIGAWDDLVQSAQLTSRYTALTFNLIDLAPLMNTAAAYRWSQWGLLIMLAAVWILIRPRDPGRAGGRVVLLLWLMAGLLIMLSQAKGYDYHWLPVLPPLALLAAEALDRLINAIGRDARLKRALPALVVIGLLAVLINGVWSVSWRYISGQEDQAAYNRRFVAGEFVADESQAVSDFLRERVVAGDSLYIWGFRPEVYYLSGLNPATRFIFQFPLVASWYPPEWREENAEILWAALPPYTLVLQVDYMPWVTGSHEDSNTLLQEYTQLNDWLIFNYEREAQIGNFFIWRRKTPPAS